MLITVRVNENGVGVISKVVRNALDVAEDDMLEIRVDGYTTTVRLRDRGRATIPANIRQELGIAEGDLVQIAVGLPEQ